MNEEIKQESHQEFSSNAREEAATANSAPVGEIENVAMLDLSG